MSKHIDYEAEAKFRTWWLNNTGGAAKDNLTVRDYFAAKVLAALIVAYKDDFNLDNGIVPRAYEITDRVMKQRALDKQGEL